MLPRFHPSVFLGTVILLCTAWLWARPPVSAIETVVRRTPRPALVVPESIKLDNAILRFVAQRSQASGHGCAPLQAAEIANDTGPWGLLAFASWRSSCTRASDSLRLRLST